VIRKSIQKYVKYAGKNTIPADPSQNDKSIAAQPVEVDLSGNGLKIPEMYGAEEEAITASLIYGAGSGRWISVFRVITAPKDSSRKITGCSTIKSPLVN